MAVLELNLRPDRRTLQSFGFIAFVAFGALGAIIYLRGGLFGFDFGDATARVAGTLWCVGGISLLFSVVAPAANRPLYVVLSLVTYPIGYVLSQVILAVVFFGIMTPIGLVFRIMGRDPMRRRFDPHAGSYWVPHRSADDTERYFRQF